MVPRPPNKKETNILSRFHSKAIEKMDPEFMSSGFFVEISDSLHEDCSANFPMSVIKFSLFEIRKILHCILNSSELLSHCSAALSMRNSVAINKKPVESFNNGENNMMSHAVDSSSDDILFQFQQHKIVTGGDDGVGDVIFRDIDSTKCYISELVNYVRVVSDKIT